MSTQKPYADLGRNSPSSFGAHRAASPRSSSSGKSRQRWSIGLGSLLVIVAVIAVLMGRGIIPGFTGATDRFGPGGNGSAGPAKGTQAVHGVVGSEKREYFEDPAVVERLRELGYTVTVNTAGSRRIATEVASKQRTLFFRPRAPRPRRLRIKA